MANNNNSAKAKDVQKADTSDELSQLRHIIFGATHQQLLKQIASLETSIDNKFQRHEASVDKRFEQLQQTLIEKFDQMNERIEFTDKTHDEHEADLQKSIANLATEHEILATTTVQDFKSIEQALNTESHTLADDFSNQIAELKSHLEDVSRELSSSKTDRKTLAKLLATMATNLEDDQL